MDISVLERAYENEMKATVKERPILFNGEMARAILAGRKTMTRRVFNGPKEMNKFRVAYLAADGSWIFWDKDFPEGKEFTLANYPSGGFWCPFGQPGDRLWVRETWKPGAWREDGRVAVDYRATPEITNTPWCMPEDFEDMWLKWTDEIISAGSHPDENGFHHWEPGKSPMKWRPSIHMPRWASRINLEITGVKVERLQDISEDDARKEGCESWCYHDPNTDESDGESAVGVFSLLWDSINGKPRKGKPDISWSANPWVWVVSFKRLAA